MFDNITIEEVNHKVFFDKDKMKLYVSYDYPYDPSEYIKREKFIKINRYLLYITKPGKYSEGNKVFRVNYYIGFDYGDFNVEDLKEITFQSNKISELFYREKGKSEQFSFSFKFDSCEFDLKLIASNKLKDTYYGHLNYESGVKVIIKKCSSYCELNKIINSILNLLSIIAVDIDIKNCKISITNKKSSYIGNVMFNYFESKEKYIKNYNFSLGNFWHLKDSVPKIINILYPTPDINLYFLSSYQSEYDNYDFFNMYSCFEYEYSKIDKNKLYENDILEKIEQQKSSALEILKDKTFPIQFLNYIKNYNPLEGHRQKLNNGLGYIREITYCDYTDKEFQEFQEKIYKLRINIVHNPNGTFIIDDTWLIMSFSQMIYILFLKRALIDDNTIKDVVKNFFVPVA